MKKTVYIGVQTFGFFKEMKQDLSLCMEKIKESGATHVEPMLMMSKKQNGFPHNFWSKRLFEKAYLECCRYDLKIESAHIFASAFGFMFSEKKIAKFIYDMYKKYGINRFVTSGMFSDDENAKKWAEFLSNILKQVNNKDVEILYHPHDNEFKPIVEQGSTHYPLDTFLQFADENIKLQFDYGWAAFAGDELFLFNRYKDKIVSLHCKDLSNDVLRNNLNRDKINPSSFKAIGEGEVKNSLIINEYLKLDLPRYDLIVDQDKSSNDRFIDNKKSVEYIKNVVGNNYDIYHPISVLEKNKLSLMTFSFFGELLLKKMKIDDLFILAKRCGLSFIDVSNLSNKNIDRYIKAKDETGVKIHCYIANIPFLNDNQEVIDKIEEQMNIASKLKANLFMIVPYASFKELKQAKQIGKEKVKQSLIKYFNIAVDISRKYHLLTCFETTPHDELALSNSSDCNYILDKVDGLGLVFDTANMLPGGEKPLEYYSKIDKKRIVYVHLKDVSLEKKKYNNIFEFTKEGEKMTCSIFGKGVIPLNDIHTSLINDHYQGIYAIEYAHPYKMLNRKKHEYSLIKHLNYFR